MFPFVIMFHLFFYTLLRKLRQGLKVENKEVYSSVAKYFKEEYAGIVLSEDMFACGI